MKLGQMLPPIRPGEILREIHLADLDMEAGTLAKKLHVSTSLALRLKDRDNSDQG